MRSVARLRGAAWRIAATVLVSAALVLGVAQPSPATAEEDGETPAAEIKGDTPAAKVKSASSLALYDPQGLCVALAALPEQLKKAKDDELAPVLDFLAEYVVVEKSRLLRMSAIEAGLRLDRKGLAARLAPKADGEDALRSTFATEALGIVGTADDIPKLLEMARSPRLYVAIAGCRAVARVGKSKHAAALIQIALEHGNITVADEAAWAAQDLLKKKKTVIGKLAKLGKKNGDATRLGAITAVIADNLAEPHAWPQKKALSALPELIAEAPKVVKIRTNNKKHRESVEAALAWMREKMPGSELLLRVAAGEIAVPLSPKDAHLDAETHAIGVPLIYTAQNDRQLSYHLLRAATVLLENRLGHPYTGRRGWTNGIFDCYDLCYEARLYSAGKGGINRAEFMETIFGKRPWGGQ